MYGSVSGHGTHEPTVEISKLTRHSEENTHALWTSWLASRNVCVCVACAIKVWQLLLWLGPWLTNMTNLSLKRGSHEPYLGCSVGPLVWTWGQTVRWSYEDELNVLLGWLQYLWHKGYVNMPLNQFNRWRDKGFGGILTVAYQVLRNLGTVKGPRHILGNRMFSS